MIKTLRNALPAMALACAAFAAQAEVVVGIIAPMTGQFARTGESWKESIDLYRKIHGDTVAGEKIRFVYRDLGEVNPTKARALAQELIVKEKAQYLGGLLYTPNAVAVAQVATQGKTPTVIFNAAGVGLLERSDYLLRVSYTQAQLTVPMAGYAAANGLKRVATLVSDYASGVDVEKTFEKAFVAKGGQITNRIRVPLDNFDFGPFMQTVKTAKPDALLVFTPGGVVSVGLVKAYKENGLEAQGIKLLAVGGEVDETSTLKTLGRTALGVYSSSLYGPTSEAVENRDFRKAFNAQYPGVEIGVTHVQGWDGAHLIYHMVKATQGRSDPDKAVQSARGLTWNSPRGPVTIDAKTRDLVQNIYIRQVQPQGDSLVNRTIQVLEKQPDWGRVAQ